MSTDPVPIDPVPIDPVPMDPVAIDHVGAVECTGLRLAEVADGRLDVQVLSCPDWTIADLVFHVAIVHTFWRQVADGETSGPDDYQEPARPADDDLLGWFRQGVADTVAVLRRVDPATPAWTWGREKNVGFIRRRLAQETAIHCWDATDAARLGEPIERDLAADGVDEFVDDVLPGMSRNLDGPAQTIALCADDVDRSRVVRAGEGTAVSVPQPDAAVDATIYAPSSDLLLLLWGRRGLGDVRVDGDVAAATAFLARAAF